MIMQMQIRIQSNTVTAGATGRWTPEEDTKLTSTVAKTKKKWWSKVHKIDWVAAAALVPGRTENQCGKRWMDALDPNIFLSAGRTGRWTEDEDLKLKNSVEMHGGKDWGAIAGLVPGRWRKQCWNRWLGSQFRPGKWTCG
jgi:Myb-like DNA-binding protein BAS1